MHREVLRTMQPTSVKAESASAVSRAMRLSMDRLTPTRRMVLDLLKERGAPASAYELIHEISRRNGRGVAPMTVYRALAFLKSRHLVTQIKLRGAYVIGAHSDAPERPSVSFLCARCGTAAEIDDCRFETLISDDARRLGFQVKRPVIEIEGTCNDCHTQKTPPERLISSGTPNPSRKLTEER